MSLMKYIPALLAIAVLTSACKKDEDPIDANNGSAEPTEDWLVPQHEVRDGGPGKDGIKALELPPMEPVGDVDYLEDGDIVVGVDYGNEVRLYPHRILDWHEIINDQIADDPYAIIYCPLTGTAQSWEREFRGNVTTFGVSGLLYNSNVIPYDRLTESNWSQVRQDCINGTLIGDKAVVRSFLEAPYAYFKKNFPNAKIVSENTGEPQDYSLYPYGNYREEPNLYFSVSGADDRIPNKERVFGIMEDVRALVFRFGHFDEGNGKAIITRWAEKDLLVVGSNFHGLINGFVLTPTQATQEWNVELVNSDLHITNSEGESFDFFGQEINGEQHLESPNSMMGFWFTFPAFFNKVDIYEEED